jgi:hypothetical protein
MNKELFVYFSTPESDCRNLMAYRGVTKMVEAGIVKDGNWECKTDNKDPLSKNYNKILYDPKVAGKILLLIHSDLIVDDLFVSEKLNARFDRCKKAGLVGIAGNRKIYNFPRKHELWHLMSDKESLLGEVTNNSTEDILSSQFTTRFGTQGMQVVLVDGCFMAIDVDRVVNAGVKFDEDCPSFFHFYDLMFSIRCFNAGIEIYVDPIRVLHKSIGLTNVTEDFELGNRFFKTNYLSKLWEKKHV